MATREENKILAYIAKHGSITRLEHEHDEVGVPIHIFLDCLGGLKLKGWVQTKEIKHENDGGRDMIINEYSFTQRVKKQLKRHYSKIEV